MAAAQTATFAEHINELRKRLMWSLLFVAIGAGIGYFLNDRIVAVLQQPLSEKLYYTTPTGAFSFIIKVCVIFGFVVSLPMVMYQTFGFFGPLLPLKTQRLLVWYVLCSTLLAVAGIIFAYFVSLPASLHFLVNFGGDGDNIQALITADEYFNFVLTYIAGFAALFQLPLVITFINRVTPLPPKKLLGATRYVVLGSFIAAAVITPTPDPFNQLLMAGPIILLFFFSALLVVVTNRARGRKQGKPVEPLHIPETVFETVAPELVPARTPLPATRPQAPAAPQRPSRLVTDMVVAGRGQTLAAYKPRQVQAQASRPSMHHQVGLISDFTPASE